jgi:hypothetical protein
MLTRAGRQRDARAIFDRVRRIAVGVLLIAACAAGGCAVNRALQQMSQVRGLAADLLVRFTQASDAANRAVMADTDAMSVDFAREAATAKDAVQTDVDALQPLLRELKFSKETELLQQFVDRFGRYKTLDQNILDLAVENTNLKAQRLSFGSAQAAADAIRDALERIKPASPGDEWHVRALAASATGSVREIQVLEAPHIADPDDSAMTRIEQRMKAAEADARHALKMLEPLVDTASHARLADASTGLDRFMAVNTQIVELSRRNTNVRSLALSLNEKRPVTSACEQSLRALNEALSKRGYQRGRWE